MARAVAFSTMITRVRERADMPGTSFATDGEISNYLNDSIPRVYRMLVKARGDGYYSATKAFSTVAGTATYTFSGLSLTDCWYVTGIDVNLGNGIIRTLETYEHAERNDYNQLAVSYTESTPLKYNMYGESFRLIPTPSGVYAGTLWYVPNPPVLSGATTFDGIAGYEELAVLWAAIACRDKNKREANVLLSEAALLKSEIEFLATRRTGGPRKVAETRGRRRWV